MPCGRFFPPSMFPMLRVLLTDEEHLSIIIWLEHISVPDLDVAVDHVREAFRRKVHRLRQNGNFAVAGVGAALGTVTGAL